MYRSSFLRVDVNDGMAAYLPVAQFQGRTFYLQKIAARKNFNG